MIVIVILIVFIMKTVIILILSTDIILIEHTWEMWVTKNKVIFFMVLSEWMVIC